MGIFRKSPMNDVFLPNEPNLKKVALLFVLFPFGERKTSRTKDENEDQEERQTNAFNF